MKKHVGRRQSRLASLLVAFALGLLGVVGLAAPASAATGNILPPFDIGTTWTICRGYDYASHTGTSEYGIDLTGSGCDNSAAGRTVRAPIDGTVAYYQVSYGNLCVNTAGGRSYTLTHISSGISSGTVVAGQAVGTVGAAGDYNNNGVAHIHFQIWGSPNCYNNSVIPFDSTNNTQICGAPDLTPTGGTDGFNNGMWSGTVFTGQSCGSSTNSSSTNRIGVLGNGTLDVKEGPVGAMWTAVGGGSSFELSPNRIAVYDGNWLNVKEGGLNATWTTVTGQVDEYHVTDNRIGIRVGSTISIKDGPIGAPWTAIGNGSSFQMSPNRIALYDGQLHVKEGPIDATWTTVTGAVDEYHVTDTRIGVLIGGQLYVKDGPIDSSWVLVGGGSAFDLS